MKLDDLLNGKDISELSDDEINAMIEKLNERDLAKFQMKIQEARSPKGAKRTTSKKQAERADQFELLMAQAARKNS